MPSVNPGLALDASSTGLASARTAGDLARG